MTTLPDGIAGDPYSETLSVSGVGSETPVWNVSVGSLPAGLTLDPLTGVISGTPTTVEVGLFSISVTAGNVFCEEDFQITITVQDFSAQNGLWWKLDEGSLLIAHDSTPGDLNPGPIFNNPPWPKWTAPGHIGPFCLEFTGTLANNHIFINSATQNFNNIPNLFSPLTLSFWYALTLHIGSQNQAAPRLFGLGDESAAHRSLDVYYVCASKEIGVFTNGGFVLYPMQDNLSWHHVAMVWPGGAGTNITAMQFYVDAVLQTSSSSSGVTGISIPQGGPGASNQAFIAVATRPQTVDTIPWHPDAMMDDLRIYNLALSQNQVKAIFLQLA